MCRADRPIANGSNGGYRRCSRSRPFRRLLDTVQPRPRADEEPAVGDGEGADDAFAHVVAGQDRQLRAAGEHDDLAVLGGQVNLAVAVDGRCQVTARVADTFVIPELLAFARL